MNKRYLKQLLLIGTLLLALIGMIVFTFMMKARINSDTVPVQESGDTNGPIYFTGEVETLSGETIQSEIQEMGELVTAEYFYTHAEDFENIKTLFGLKIPMTKTTLIYTVDGNIMAGIDFTAVTVEVDDEAKTVKISLPSSRIIASEIDHDSFALVNEKEGWFNDLSAEDVNRTFAHVKELEEQKAIENGVLDRADENAVRIIQSFVKNLDLNSYTVEVGK